LLSGIRTASFAKYEEYIYPPAVESSLPGQRVGCTSLIEALNKRLHPFSISNMIKLEIENSLFTLPITPVVNGYDFDEAPDLASSVDRERLSTSAIKAFVKITEKSSLNETQARGLLGGIASSTYHAWRTEPRGRKLDQDTLMRISLLIGIYKALNIYFSKPWADRWITLANRGHLFGGHAPIDYMLRHGQPSMIQLRRMLDSWRGGR
jgi:hypothetical protein